MAARAELVCTVEITRWPVRAAWTAMRAVSGSRISPTMMMSGSCRRIERSPAAKVRPISPRTCTWTTPGRSNSTGSSTVTILRTPSFRWVSRR